MNALYRGKDKNTKQWIYGYLVIANDPIHEGKHYIIEDTSDFSYGDNGNRIRIGCFKEVVPETVGRFTELTDKNGTRIFEHDIILSQTRKSRPYSSKALSKRLVGVVEYYIGAGNNFYDCEQKQFTKYYSYEAKWRVQFNTEDNAKYPYSCWGDFYDCEVIGNIFDNPHSRTNLTIF